MKEKREVTTIQVVRTMFLLTSLFYVCSILKITHIIEWNWRWVTSPIIPIIAIFAETLKFNFSKSEIEKILKSTIAIFALFVYMKVKEIIDWNWLIVTLPLSITLLFVSNNIAKRNNHDDHGLAAEILSTTVWFVTKSLFVLFIVIKIFKLVEWNWLWLLSAIPLVPCLFGIMIALIFAIKRYNWKWPPPTGDSLFFNHYEFWLLYTSYFLHRLLLFCILLHIPSFRLRTLPSLYHLV